MRRVTPGCVQLQIAEAPRDTHASVCAAVMGLVGERAPVPESAAMRSSAIPDVRTWLALLLVARRTGAGEGRWEAPSPVWGLKVPETSILFPLAGA